ncbi:FecCD family ABC transporter permease [Micromonospora yangpuensis]|uniref:Iron complex transport system permease protein n=1 Tax=Micromonospora yangpuensis TaxID=683228 RepID=A0A1C6U2G2_9ACTN|nr:iron ABC transporter permease [Micromonospora yangpuensis]GGM10572.1 iron ABC transporter permease [Micromonospora yangpuensis]SCL48069.1 iron complex transport system permease protein [Micromonospora yangpuensis]
MTGTAARAGRTRSHRSGLVLGALALTGVAFCVVAVGIGSATIPSTTVVEIVGYRLTGLGDPSRWTLIQDDIVWNLRLPRVALAILVGAALSVVGVVSQGVMRNPLADPYVLGISSGAAFGAVAWLVLGAAAFGGATVGVAAFAGAIVALLTVAGFVRVTGSFSSGRLVLAGIVIGTGFSGMTNFLIFTARDQGTTNSALFWLLGSLAGARWDQLLLPTVVLLTGILVVLLMSRQLNALLFGDATAAALGIDPHRVRLLLYVVAAALTGVSVALSGVIAFVGLVVPHAARLLVGSDHRRLTPVAAILGAVFMVAVDLLGRVVMSPEELPVGVVTAVLGAPAFLLLMARRGGRLGEP